MKKTTKFAWFSFDLRLPVYQPTTLLQKTSTKQNKNPTQKKPHKIRMKDPIQKNLSVTLDSE